MDLRQVTRRPKRAVRALAQDDLIEILGVATLRYAHLARGGGTRRRGSGCWRIAIRTRKLHFTAVRAARSDLLLSLEPARASREYSSGTVALRDAQRAADLLRRGRRGEAAPFAVVTLRNVSARCPSAMRHRGDSSTRFEDE